ncbi:methylthioadenosine phosphorylase [Alicyclobacillus hesperidum URH17-3-68]|uniref:S-methyl-5'-thioadenosine phosphorylase n=1 Tax=Alicyclobacillus hesperidum TaxID=89784 RepID=UPI0002819C28|nr:S-methyl-5'-thioadenosine phosphorylase [Alicyclobacillus hesperidum]EJY55053.1 methylthioadenosine phosphorylase [Alicyclobacillus hesperidum URH17-3-68]
MSIQYAIIGGTGVYQAGDLANAEQTTIHTPYGDALATIGEYQGKQIAFLARHGTKHNTPPHRVNYRANIMALKQLGVEQVLATAAVGSLNRRFRPGDLVIVDDAIDMTKGRISTFFDEGPVVHVDVSDPYCARLRHGLRDVAGQFGIAVHHGGVYVCSEGPRFETKAEIGMYARFGGDLVGMTSMPEAVLAKEAELCYATVCMVTNWAAGFAGQPLTHEEVVASMRANVDQIRQLFLTWIANDTGNRTCTCQHAVGGQIPLVGEDGQ